MSGQLTRAIKLTPAQLALIRELVTLHERMGDCNLHGYTLGFPDYEGASAFQRKLFGIRTPTTRAYASLMAIVKKIDAAIVKAAGKAVA